MFLLGRKMTTFVVTLIVARWLLRSWHNLQLHLLFCFQRHARYERTKPISSLISLECLCQRKWRNIDGKTSWKQNFWEKYCVRSVFVLGVMEEEFAAIHAANSWDLVYRVSSTHNPRKELWDLCFVYCFLRCFVGCWMVIYLDDYICFTWRNACMTSFLQQISNESRNNDFTAVEALKVENKQLNRWMWCF